MSAHGGQQSSLVALYRRKYVDRIGGDYCLTDAGYEEALRIIERREKRFKSRRRIP